MNVEIHPGKEWIFPKALEEKSRAAEARWKRMPGWATPNSMKTSSG
jgi:hypothetical protein